MTWDLTKGSELKTMVLFSIPMIVGNLLQQLYNIVDTLIVGRVLGPAALAAVGSSFALMGFLTSVNLGFCMGSGAVFAQLFGARRIDDLKTGICNAFVFIGAIAVVINLLTYLFMDRLLMLLNVQPEVFALCRTYLMVVLSGIMFTFLYNFFAAALRSIGNSVIPLVFLAVAAVLNIILDIVFVIPLGWGVAGAALATVIAQAVSALCIILYFFHKAKEIRPSRRHIRFRPRLLRWIISNSVLTSIQQSVMNFGILMIQGLVNSFGVAAMAAFAAAVKIDAFAYMPLQDFGNAFATYTAQNYGAGETARIRRGGISAAGFAIAFGLLISMAIFLFAERLMQIFVDPAEWEIIGIGARYLRIEGVFYPLIGILFLLYALYRGVGRPGMSLVLTVISLGTRVLLSYTLAPHTPLGLNAIWWSIPIGWAIADLVGFGYYLLRRGTLLDVEKA